MQSPGREEPLQSAEVPVLTCALSARELVDYVGVYGTRRLAEETWWVQCGSEAWDWPSRMGELFAAGDLFLVEGPCLRQRLIEFGRPAEKIYLVGFNMRWHDLVLRMKDALAAGTIDPVESLRLGVGGRCGRVPRARCCCSTPR